MLVTFEVVNMPKQVFSKLFTLLHRCFALLFLLDLLQLKRGISQYIIYQHLSQLIRMEVHHPSTHLVHSSDAATSEQPIFVTSLVGCLGDFHVLLRLLYTLQHRP